MYKKPRAPEQVPSEQGSKYVTGRTPKKECLKKIYIRAHKLIKVVIKKKRKHKPVKSNHEGFLALVQIQFSSPLNIKTSKLHSYKVKAQN